MEEVWERLNQSLSTLAADLKEHNARLAWTAGHSGNPAMPFRGWASFSREGVAGEEDLVISVDFTRTGHALRVDVDFADGEGHVLADAPTVEIPLATDTASLRQAILASAGAVEDFISVHRSLLCEQLG